DFLSAALLDRPDDNHRRMRRLLPLLCPAVWWPRNWSNDKSDGLAGSFRWKTFAHGRACEMAATLPNLLTRLPSSSRLLPPELFWRRGCPTKNVPPWCWPPTKFL